MTNGMTKPAAPVEQFARRGLRFGFELRPPVLKGLERKPLSLTILSLIQIALLPALVMGPPKGLTITLARAPSVRHLFLLTFANRPVRTDRVRHAQNKRAKNGRLRLSLLARLNSLISRKNSLLWLQKFPAAKFPTQRNKAFELAR
jgi:hypothetical protein